MKWMFCAALGMGLSPVVAHAAERYAVLVGSNAEVLGRSPLRYAHVDAKRLAGALSELGEFDESNLRLLLDPRPQEVLAALDGLLAKAVHDPDAVLLFYYSGHADRGSLYPDGAPLPLSEVRKRLEDPRARLRLGIVDACEGGGWTGTKGFSPDAPIALPDEPAPRVEGTVFVASSSGGQSAHESDAVGGSFFTHHLVAALRGAADKDGDGTVSLSETFAYARRRTIRDAATYTDGEQSPSFRLRLTGREDVALSFVERGESHLVIGARPQLLQVVDLDSGAAVAEVPASEKDLTLALRAGRYLIRQRDAEGTRHAREVQLE
ncbi:MAG: caspase family protein, partial [Myxococcota bacterium]